MSTRVTVPTLLIATLVGFGLGLLVARVQIGDNSNGTVTAAGTGGLLIVTSVYVWLVYKQLGELRRQRVDEAERWHQERDREVLARERERSEESAWVASLRT